MNPVEKILSGTKEVVLKKQKLFGKRVKNVNKKLDIKEEKIEKGVHEHWKHKEY